MTIGAAATALGTVMLTLGLVLNANDFASSSDQGTQAAHDAARSGGLVVAGTVPGLIGLFPLAAGFVMVAIAAMRVGLLTRFVGVLGAIVGVLQILGPLSAGVVHRQRVLAGDGRRADARPLAVGDAARVGRGRGACRGRASRSCARSASASARCSAASRRRAAARARRARRPAHRDAEPVDLGAQEAQAARS